MSTPHPTDAPKPGRQKHLARAGLALMGSLSVWLAGASTFHIMNTVFAPPAPPTDEPCEVGIRRLFDAVERARNHAATQSLSERDALSRFRADVNADWANFPSVQATCRSDGNKNAQKALRSVELLRYAEENAVRWTAVDLTRFRRKTPRLVEELDGRAP